MHGRGTSAGALATDARASLWNLALDRGDKIRGLREKSISISLDNLSRQIGS